MTAGAFGLTTIRRGKGEHVAALSIDNSAAPLDELVGHFGSKGFERIVGRSVFDMLQDWDAAFPQLFAMRLRLTETFIRSTFTSFAELDIGPPVSFPRQVFCTGANYRKHVVDLTIDMGVGPEGLDAAGLRRWAEEMMDERARNGSPYAFTKPVSSIAGAFDPLPLPPYEDNPDWELELAVVIGRAGFAISQDKAMDHVAGYAIVNDVTARSLIPRTDYKQLGTDWLRAKGQPGFLPFGPIFVPKQFVPDPYALKLRLSVNDRVMQDERAADMIFDIGQQISHISKYARLLPGDLICTGSPAGNGTHYNQFLRPGDRMTGEIDGLGKQVIDCTKR